MVENNQEAEGGAHQDTEIEARARRMGWKPETEYDNRGTFMSAEDFIKKGEEDLPLLKARNRKLDSDLTRVFKELSDVKTTFDDFRKFMTNSEQRAYEKARKELIERRDVAVAHADTDTFHAANKEIEALDNERPKASATQERQRQPQIDPIADQWVKDNPWFLRDPQLNLAAKALDTDLLESTPGLSTEERLATVKSEVARMYPDKFKNPLRSAAASVAQPSGEGGGSRSRRDGKSYDDLPAEAKKACDKFVKTIKGYTREEYLKNYDWSN